MISKNRIDRRDFFKNTTVIVAALLGCGGVMGLLPNQSGAKERPLRPPGALDEAEFLPRCIRCLRCVNACPNNAIISLDDSFGRNLVSTPAIKPRRQACMLCNKIDSNSLKCTEVCPSGALRLVRKDPDEIRQKVAIGTAKIDRGLCYSYNSWTCGVCYRACPFPGQAMTLGTWERPEVHAGACIGCGLCERACIRYPQAIRVNAGVV